MRHGHGWRKQFVVRNPTAMGVRTKVSVLPAANREVVEDC
jgi:hypothetical protein